MSRKAITIKYQGTGSVMLYGPEIPYVTQRAGVKAAVAAIVNNSSGSGATAFYEIWLDGPLVKTYRAKYKTTTQGDVWEISNPHIKGGLS